MIRNLFFSFFDLFKYKKPQNILLLDYFLLIFSKIRYQPLIFLDGSIIENKCSNTIIDSRVKIQSLGIPKNLKEKSFLDIGCAEGFFLIEAHKRGASVVKGCDILKSRIKIAKILLKNWKLDHNSCVENLSLLKLNSSWKSDIVTCLSVTHHLHGHYKHDTWKILNNSKKYPNETKNIFKNLALISKLTNEMAIIEYCYEYKNEKPAYVDYNLLSKEIINRNIFREFKFICLSASSNKKDRVIYHGFN